MYHILRTYRLPSSSFLGLPYRILHINHKKELLRSLWVEKHPKVPKPQALQPRSRKALALPKVRLLSDAVLELPLPLHSLAMLNIIGVGVLSSAAVYYRVSNDSLESASCRMLHGCCIWDVTANKSSPGRGLSILYPMNTYSLHCSSVFFTLRSLKSNPQKETQGRL